MSPEPPKTFTLQQDLEDTLARSGLSFEKVSSVNGMVFRSAEFDKNKGFHFEIVETGMRWMICWSLERFAADLGSLIRSQAEGDYERLRALEAEAFESRQLGMRVNGKQVSCFKSALAIDNWNDLALELRIDKPVVGPRNREDLQFLMTLTLLLLPIEDADSLPMSLDDEFQVEGAVKIGAVTKYERSAKNRRICLTIHGYDCKICGLSMEQKYGSIGHEYIHVHHIIPVSRMGEVRVVNPHSELIPVCPNCHYMLHASDPPIEPSKLKEIIAGDGLQNS